MNYILIHLNVLTHVHATFYWESSVSINNSKWCPYLYCCVAVFVLLFVCLFYVCFIVLTVIYARNFSVQYKLGRTVIIAVISHERHFVSNQRQLDWGFFQQLVQSKSKKTSSYKLRKPWFPWVYPTASYANVYRHNVCWTPVIFMTVGSV